MNIRPLVLTLAVLGAIVAIAILLVATQNYSVARGKALSPPRASGSEWVGEGAHPINLDRFNLSNGSAPAKQEVLRIIRDWIEGNATQEETRLAIALWRNSSASTSDH